MIFRRRETIRQLLLLQVFVFPLADAATSTTAAALEMETVRIGHVGNRADQWFGITIGAVNYRYSIGKYEVTNQQYAEFLNAVARSDSNELYDTRMASQIQGGILRSGVAGSYTYTTKPHMHNKPVNYVNFWDATRFANWLHNGQPTGPQGPTTTENGAYTLTPAAMANNTVTRNPGAVWFLPSRDEWYKAAYYQPAALGGDSNEYWDYATATNLTPTAAFATSTGDIVNPGFNVVNYRNRATWPGFEANVTTVGSAGPLSRSFFGTYDQTGNVGEWTETIDNINYRGIYGGSFFFTDVRAQSRGLGTPNLGGDAAGFRIATLIVPEPATLNLLLLAIILLRLRRCRPAGAGG